MNGSTNKTRRQLTPLLDPAYRHLFKKDLRVFSFWLYGWHGNNPDLHLMEKVWCWVQSEINKKACRTFAKLEREVHNVFMSILRSTSRLD